MSNDLNLFPEFENEIQKEWQDMPEFIQNDLEPYKQIIVSFRNANDYKAFGKLVKQTVTPRTQSIWWPKAIIDTYMDKRYTTKDL